MGVHIVRQRTYSRLTLRRWKVSLPLKISKSSYVSVTSSDKCSREVEDVFSKVLSLCSRRGFLFKTGSQFAPLRGVYDYGSLGVELKRNISNEWWKRVVTSNSEVSGIKTCQLMPSAVWKASGHLDGFTDSIVDCSLSGTQFRVDKAGPVVTATSGLGETTITILAPHKKTAKLWEEQIQTDFAADARVVREGCLLHLSVAELVDSSTATDGSKVPGRIELRTQNSDLETIKIEYNGYVCPITNSPFLGTPRDINLMYQVVAIDDSAPFSDSDEQYTLSDEFDSMIRTIRKGNPSQKAEMRNSLKREFLPRSMYLRPETAQGTYVQTPNAKRSLEESGPRPTTFGLAQIGESYRNEIAVEHFSFRSSEFDQMEMQYFCPAQDEKQCFNFWVRDRLAWWHDLARVPEDFITLNVDKEDLAHYASACVDIEYRYPWGFDEIEGIASRSNYDMNLHSKYHELEKTNVDDGGLKESFVIEPAAGLSRAVLAFLCDAYTEDVRTDAKGEYIQTVLQLHPKLSPYKAAVLPLVRNNAEFVKKALDINEDLLANDLSTSYDDGGAIGKRYAKHDEIGTPLCITIDQLTLDDGSVTLRDRRDGSQRRIACTEVADAVQKYIAQY